MKINCTPLLLLLLFSMSCQKKEVSIPPNVILIITDDQGYGDLGIHNNPNIVTPAIDAFGRQRVSEPLTLFDSKQLHDKQP